MTAPKTMLRRLNLQRICSGLQAMNRVKNTATPLTHRHTNIKQSVRLITKQEKSEKVSAFSANRSGRRIGRPVADDSGWMPTEFGALAYPLAMLVILPCINRKSAGYEPTPSQFTSQHKGLLDGQNLKFSPSVLLVFTLGAVYAVSTTIHNFTFAVSAGR